MCCGWYCLARAGSVLLVLRQCSLMRYVTANLLNHPDLWMELCAWPVFFQGNEFGFVYNHYHILFLTPQRYWQILFLVAFSGKIFYFNGLHISNLCTRSCLNSNDCHYLNLMGFELKKYISDFFKLGLYCQTSFKWLWSRLIEILEGNKSLFLGFRILNP